MYIKEFNMDSFSSVKTLLPEVRIILLFLSLPRELWWRGLQAPLLNNSPRMSSRSLLLNFSLKSLLICHPSELHVTCSAGLQMVPHEYYSTCRTSISHLFALFSYHNASWWDTFPPWGARGSSRLQRLMRALLFTRNGKNSSKLNTYLSFQGHWGIFNLGHTCDSQERHCPCFWVELLFDGREGNKQTERHSSCIVSPLCLSIGT